MKTKSQKKGKDEKETPVLRVRLRELRRNKNLSQQIVAESLGLSRDSAYQKYESGHVAPPPDKLAKLAELFGVSTDYLLGRTDDATPPMQLAAVADDLLARSLQQACRAELEVKLAGAGGDPKRLAELKTRLTQL